MVVVNIVTSEPGPNQPAVVPSHVCSLATPQPNPNPSTPSVPSTLSPGSESIEEKMGLKDKACDGYGSTFVGGNKAFAAKLYGRLVNYG